MPKYNDKKNSCKNNPISYELAAKPYLHNLHSSANDKKVIESAVDQQLLTLADLKRLKDALERFRGLTRGSSKFFKIKYLPTGMREVVDMISTMSPNRLTSDACDVLTERTTTNACEVLSKLKEVAASSRQRWTFGGRDKKTTKAYAAINNFFERNPPRANTDISSLCEAIEQIVPPPKVVIQGNSTKNIFYIDTSADISTDIDSSTFEI